MSERLRLADLLRAGLLGVLGARVGAEHEDRVGRGERIARAAELVVGGVETFDDCICAETRKSTSEIASQATSAMISQRRTRHGLIRGRRRRRRGPGARPGCGGVVLVAARRVALHLAQPAVVRLRLRNRGFAR